MTDRGATGERGLRRPPPAPRRLRQALDAAARGARSVPGVAWVAAIAAVGWVVAPGAAYPHYDFAFSLSAGQDILAGRMNSYEVLFRTPLPHPLNIFLAVVAALFGSAGFTVWSIISMVFFGLLVYAVFSLGRELFTWPVGLLAAILVFTASEVFLLGLRGYGDLKFAALVIFAAALEARRTRRGWPVLALLGLAGLLRPEAWILAAVYWVYLWPSRGWRARVGLAGLVAASPALWFLTDFLLVGHPLYSTEHAQAFAQHSQWSVDLASAPRALVWRLETIAGARILLAGAVAGVVFGALRYRTRVVMPVALAALGALLPMGMALGGGTIAAPRFFVVPAAIAMLFFSVAVVGWIGATPKRLLERVLGCRVMRSRAKTKQLGAPHVVTVPRVRRCMWGAEMRRFAAGYARTASQNTFAVPWIAVAAALAILFALTLPQRLRAWDRGIARQAERVQLMESLDRLLRETEARASIARCRPIYAASYYFRPYVRYWLDAAPLAVDYGLPATPPERGLVIVRTEEGERRQGPSAERKGGRPGRLFQAIDDGRYRRVAGNRWFEVLATPGCR